MTIQDILSTTTLDKLDAELILAFTLNVGRPHIKAHPEQTLTLFQKVRFFLYVKKRKNNTPLAYITGHKEFYGLDFEVNKHTLVPRPETELLVELAVNKMKFSPLGNTIPSGKREELEGVHPPKTLLIDIGTGSGCIPISILSSVIQSKSKDPLKLRTSEQERDSSIAPLNLNDNVVALATDISKPALRTAQRSATKHNVDITFVHGNLLEPITQILDFRFLTYDSIIITANLPYITEEQFADEPSIKREPHSALVADENGLALYRELLEQLTVIKPQSPTTLYFEIDPTQKEPVQSLIREYYKDAILTVHNDLCDHARIVEISI